MGGQAVDQHQFVVLFRAQHHHAFARFELTNQQFIGDDVERLLGFTLHIEVADRAQRAIEAGGTQTRRDALGRT